MGCIRRWATLSMGVLSISVGTSCGSSGRKLSARPSLLEPTRALESRLTPAEWRYHPRQAARLARSYPVGAEGRLLVGGLGERWLIVGEGDRAQPASMLAPEPLVGVLEAHDAPFVFVGESGTTYEADSPIGPLLSASAPLEALARVDPGNDNVLGVTRDGALVLSEDAGASWHPVGPSASRFADVLLASPYGLALEVPERLWWSETEGRTWQALDTPPFGAERLARDEEAGPVVTSVLGARSVRFEGSPKLTPLNRVLRPDEPQLSILPIEGPSAKAIALGRAFISGGRYFEVSLGVKAESVSGEFTGPLQREALPLFSACKELRVAGYERWVYAACTREQGSAALRFEFYRSEDSGRHFEREVYAARGNPEQLRLAVGDAGVLLATGLCLPHESLAGCRPQGILQRQDVEADAGASVALRPVPAPALEENALGLAFATDGRTAYAVGLRTKSDAVFAFVSTDLARGFTARPIGLSGEANPRGPSQIHQLTPASDGQVSLVVSRASGPQRLVTLDAAARSVSVNGAPLEAAVIGAYGARALAVSPDQVWESLNGGAEWESVGRLPRSICSASDGRCSISIQCQAEGCAVGDSLSRVGWRGQAQHSAALWPPSGVKSSTLSHRALGPAYGCELSNSEWTELRGVERLPDASQAALGKAAWFALARDDATAAAGLWVAELARGTLDRSVKLRYVELLGPTERAAETAYLATLQVEGAAALRYRIPGSPGASKTALTNVEVAWDNLIDGQHGHAIIADAGGHLPGDFVKGDGMARRAQPDLVSIASGGVFVRVHKSPQHDQPSFFLDGASHEEVPPLRWPATAAKGSSSEMARLGRQNVPLLFVNQGATVVRARRRGGAWQFDAMSAGFAEVANFSLSQSRDITYFQGQAAIHLTTRRSDASSESSVFPLQLEGPVFGAPIAVPTQADLGDGPLSCSARQRSETSRVVAPGHPGRRRPLVVHDAVEPVRVLLTESAILHGTPEAPCAEVFDAELVKVGAAPSAARERALLSVDGPSWLFRLAPDNVRRDPRVEYRMMQCRPDPGLEIPPDVYELPGTRSEG